MWRVSTPDVDTWDNGKGLDGRYQRSFMVTKAYITFGIVWIEDKLVALAPLNIRSGSKRADTPGGVRRLRRRDNASEATRHGRGPAGRNRGHRVDVRLGTTPTNLDGLMTKLNMPCTFRQYSVTRTHMQPKYSIVHCSCSSKTHPMICHFCFTYCFLRSDD